MLKLMLTLALLTTISCSSLDRVLTPNPKTGTSSAQDAASVVAGSGILGPYGEAGLLILTALQNLYLGGRHIQRRLRTRTGSGTKPGSST